MELKLIRLTDIFVISNVQNIKAEETSIKLKKLWNWFDSVQFQVVVLNKPSCFK